MEEITMPVKQYVEMRSPYIEKPGPSKVRFFVPLKDVPASLKSWMTTNPREQNLSTPVAKAIMASIKGDGLDFHLKNRGILLSAKTVQFIPSAEGKMDGTAILQFEDESLHGNVDGGHTLKLILEAQKESTLSEQYVEFEVIVGIDNLVPVAEARNTSVALDIRTMEEMKGSFEVLKEILGDVEIENSRFFDRVELKMNQQLEEANCIDIRTLISIILMFNQELYPVTPNESPKLIDNPVQMYGNPEAALKKYLTLGGGDSAKRTESIQKMAPVLKDIVALWDTVERELPVVNPKKFAKLCLHQKQTAPKAMFSNIPLDYALPRSVLYPIVSAFRVLIRLDCNGSYSWIEDPSKIWNECKESIVSSFFMSMKSARNNPNTIVKKSLYWHQYVQIVMISLYKL